MSDSENKFYYITLVLQPREIGSEPYVFKDKGNAASNPFEIPPGKYAVFLKLFPGRESDSPADRWRVFSTSGKRYFEKDEDPPQFSQDIDPNKCLFAVELDKGYQWHQKKTPELISNPNTDMIKVAREVEITPEVDSIVIHGTVGYNFMKRGFVHTRHHHECSFRYWFKTKDS